MSPYLLVAAGVTAAHLLLMALACLVLWRRERDPVLRCWAGGFALGAMAEGFGAVPGLPAMAAAGALQLAMAVCTMRGLRRLLRLPELRGMWALTVLASALYAASLLLEPWPATRMSLRAWPHLAACGAIALLLLPQLRRQRLSGGAAALTIVAVALTALSTAAASLADLPPTPDAWPLPVISVLLASAGVLALILGLLLLYVEQLLLRLECAANTDMLTGLRNRRRFNEMADGMLARSRGGKQMLWLLMIDIDHFKNINDRYGHDVGDRVLQQVSRVLHDTLRGDDIIARYGGEEFCVLLPDTDAHAAGAAAQRLLKAVSLLRVGPEADHRVTVSIGAAALDDDRASLEGLLKHADLALYQAKCAGRNRIAGFASDGAVRRRGAS